MQDDDRFPSQTGEYNTSDYTHAIDPAVDDDSVAGGGAAPDLAHGQAGPEADDGSHRHPQPQHEAQPAEAEFSPRHQHHLTVHDDDRIHDADTHHDDAQALEAVMQLAQAASQQHQEYQEQLERFHREQEQLKQQQQQLREADEEVAADEERQHRDDEQPRRRNSIEMVYGVGEVEGFVEQPRTAATSPQRKRRAEDHVQGGEARTSKAPRAEAASGEAPQQQQQGEAAHGLTFTQSWAAIGPEGVPWHSHQQQQQPTSSAAGSAAAAPESVSAPAHPSASESTSGAPTASYASAATMTAAPAGAATAPSASSPPSTPVPTSGGGAASPTPSQASPVAAAPVPPPPSATAAGGSDSEAQPGVEGTATETAAGKSSRQLSTSKRAAQNRAAQRAFRERRDKYVKELEGKAARLEEALRSADEHRKRHRDAIVTIDELRQDNHSLRVALAALGGHVAGPPPVRG
ncbi:hypothetical protein ACQY0O_004715 [Thecaphora frezii]